MSITGDMHVAKNRQKTFPVTVTDSLGAPINLTGQTLYFTVKRVLDDDLTDANAVISKNITNHSDPTNGISSVVILSTDTSSLEVGKYFFDLQFGANKLPSGNGNFYIDRPTKLA
jgi:hypothetical protein